jgi:NADPH2:quinone reductase
LPLDLTRQLTYCFHQQQTKLRKGAMTRAVRIYETGGPEVMQIEDINLPEPQPHEVRVKHTAIGLNFIDTYHRSGLYPLPLPAGLGMEAAGIVEALGSNVTHLKPGDRIAFAGATVGTYAEACNVPADRVSKIPEDVDDETAAAMMLKGMTVQYLLRQTFDVKPGDTLLFHAAAGGVGLIACQWAKALGATVIGTVGSKAKAELARAHGCDHTILYREEDVATRVRELTDGKGVPVVYDSVGASTFEASLDCLQPRGLLVSFGNSSGPVTGVDLGILAAKGSAYVTRPTLVHYTLTSEALEACAKDLFDVVASGDVSIEIHQRYPLDDIVKAHQDLESRNTTGATVITPN